MIGQNLGYLRVLIRASAGAVRNPQPQHCRDRTLTAPHLRCVDSTDINPWNKTDYKHGNALGCIVHGGRGRGGGKEGEYWGTGTVRTETRAPRGVTTPERALRNKKFKVLPKYKPATYDIPPYLGITVNNKLIWKDHNHSIRKKNMQI